MENQELISYIQKQKELKVPKETYVAALLSQGWSKRDIRRAANYKLMGILSTLFFCLFICGIASELYSTVSSEMWRLPYVFGPNPTVPSNFYGDVSTVSQLIHYKHIMMCAYPSIWILTILPLLFAYFPYKKRELWKLILVCLASFIICMFVIQLINMFFLQ